MPHYHDIGHAYGFQKSSNYAENVSKAVVIWGAIVTISKRTLSDIELLKKFVVTPFLLAIVLITPACGKVWVTIGAQIPNPSGIQDYFLYSDFATASTYSVATWLLSESSGRMMELPSQLPAPMVFDGMSYIQSANTQLLLFNDGQTTDDIHVLLPNSSGTLSEISGSPFIGAYGYWPYGGYPVYASGDADYHTGNVIIGGENYGSVSNGHDGFRNAASFLVNYSNLSVAQVSNIPLTLNHFPLYEATTPDGQYAYYADMGPASGGGISPLIMSFSVNQATGVLSALATYGFTCTAANGAYTDLAIDPTGNYLFVVCLQSGANSSILSYKINADGSLTAAAVTSLNSALGVAQIAIDRTGSYLYMSANGVGFGIYGWAIQTTGVLVALNGGLAFGGGAQNGLVLAANNFMYGGGTSSLFELISGTGSLSYNSFYSSACAGLANENGGFFDPTGKYLYTVANNVPRGFCGHQFADSSGDAILISGINPNLTGDINNNIVFLKVSSQKK